MICDEAHTALGEKTSAAIRSFPEPVYIGMTATEQLIAKQVSDVFPASVDDLPLADAARRGLIAPLRCLRVPPAAAINSVPIVGGDFDQEALAKVLDHVALNQAAASLYRDRFDSTPGIVYAAGVDHAYNLAQEFRVRRPEGRGGQRAHAARQARRDPRRLRARRDRRARQRDAARRGLELTARDRGHAPRADREPKRVYQQRIGRIMRLHPRKEAGVVVDFVQKGATHNDRVVTLHSLLGADFYREGARVTPAPRRRVQRKARRKLSPAPWLVPVTPDVNRRLAVIQREWQRVDPRYLDEEEQRFWARIAGRQARFDDRVALFEKLTARASKAALEQFLFTCAAENPNRRLRLMALSDRVGMTVDRASFDDLVTLVTQAPPWEKDRVQGVRVLLRAIGEGRPDAPDQILARWTWRLARAVRKVLDRKASAPSTPRRSGSSARSRTRAASGTRRTRSSSATPRRSSRSEPPPRCSPRPRATRRARTTTSRRRARSSAPIQEVANALADDLPAPKAHPGPEAAPAAQEEADRRRDAERRAERQAAERNRCQAPQRRNGGSLAPMLILL